MPRLLCNAIRDACCERLMMSHHPSTRLRTGLASSGDFHYSRFLRCLTFLLFGTEFVDKLQAYIRSFLCTINNLTLRSFAIATALEIQSAACGQPKRFKRIATISAN